MPLHTVTLTGVDGFTRYEDLVGLSQEFPFVEFGILYDAGLQGKTPRYPCIATIADFAGRKVIIDGHTPRMALHICGDEAINEFLDNASSLTSKLARPFDRVQLNRNFHENDLPKLDSALARNPKQVVITPHTLKTDPMRWASMESKNHAILFDDSHGTGKQPEEWPTPLRSDTGFGYAGGLGIANFATELPKMERAAARYSFMHFARLYSVDMESSLRDEHDRFSPTRCEQVLKIAAPFVASGLSR